MVKKVCLLLSVLAIFPSIRSEDEAMQKLYRLNAFESYLTTAIVNNDLLSCRHGLRRFAHIDGLGDDKKKLLNDLICVVDDRIEMIKQDNVYYYVGGGFMGAFGALMMYAAYAIHSLDRALVSQGRVRSINSAEFEAIFGILGIGTMGFGIYRLLFEKSGELKKMQSIRLALEEANKE